MSSAAAVNNVRWEQGSYADLPSLVADRRNQDGREDRLPGGVLTGSGRIALTALLDFGRAERGWRRIWIPSYYCPDVVEHLARGPLNVRQYVCGPWGKEDTPELQPDDVLLRVAYFGWGPLPAASFAADVIEDHTHHPMGGWSSSASYAFASLRKCLPIPDGGLVWSPRGLPLPRAPMPDPRHDGAVLKRLAAMAMKRAYLAGEAIDKGSVRALELAAEERFLEGHQAPISAWSQLMLERLSIRDLNHARRCNHAVLRAALRDCQAVTVLGPEEPEAPVAAILRVSGDCSRDALRTHLTEEGIYTAVLWPMPHRENGAADDPRARDYSASTLAVHVDARYAADDMQRVAGRIMAGVDNARLHHG